ncbi:MAG: acetyl-CoA carboxylase carboxyltransferase subunit alpha [Clostridiales bacterium]|nr:acetyl-CoA carboxylase carboxyltransferase subunit alpha [Clostridiales bacterium]
MNNLELELRELEKKIIVVKEFIKTTGIDLSGEYDDLEEKRAVIMKKISLNLNPWQRVQIARHKSRPNFNDYINGMLNGFMEFHGDRTFRDDNAIVGGVGYLFDIPVTFISHAKGKTTEENVYRNFGMPHPEGYRKVFRLMKQAEKFKRPIICLIDTPGAYCGIGAEERGQGEAIARNLLEMSDLKTPIISVVIGEGGSGGALALGVADKVLMLENSIYSVISPEGCASILLKDSTKAEEASKYLKLTAQDLLNLNIIDGIINEAPGGAHNDTKLTVENVRNEIYKSLKELLNKDINDVIDERYKKIRSI